MAKENYGLDISEDFDHIGNRLPDIADAIEDRINIYLVNKEWTVRMNFKFTLEDWHISSKVAYWIAFTLPDWFFR